MKVQVEERKGVVDNSRIKITTVTKGDVSSCELKSQSKFDNIVVQCYYGENLDFEQEYRRFPMVQKVIINVLEGNEVVDKYMLYAQNRQRSNNSASYINGEIPIKFYYSNGKIQFKPLNQLLERINDKADLFTVAFVNSTLDIMGGYVIRSTPEYVLDIKNQLPVSITNIEQGKGF